ncbi:MAG: hypothetical protein H6709_11645 [Kofleriaceae bacterium]|nr:hypothetical protein [Myxococcales bacterium]MCB9562894.1 hypothetical protein [Kofleriaceae bacterium]MCB9572729.1 hypothetical protein [Kofleriaceae bacterium]
MKSLPPLVLALSLVACKSDPKPPAARAHDAGATAPPAAPRHDALNRADFNRWAVRENLALFWTADRDHDDAVDPDEVATLLFYPDAPTWVANGAFTPAFEDAYQRLVAASKAPAPTGDDAARRALVARDLDQGRATLVDTDLSKLSAGDKAFAGHMLEVATLIDQLYDTQTGAAALAAKVPADDPASQSLFRRNRGPGCAAPATEHEAGCSAIPGAPEPRVDVYPEALQAKATFCKDLEERPDAEKLMAPFVVVRQTDAGLTAVPYTEAYAAPMAAIAKHLDEAAAALVDPGEDALRAYLKAAAASFASNDWQPADEAWSRMNAENSKWYVRVGPDETYWEPCSRKAAFHLTFARINQDSLAWQTMLSPLQQDLEIAVATATGNPYTARTVSFHLPDFIDIIVNAGDDRDPLSATVGQSLPNWGPVASEGRGRTVAMSNLYTDPDSLAARRAGAESLLDAASATAYDDSAGPGLLSTVLHEATHNLGPTNEYRLKGKTSDQLLGGTVASIFEELKAQTGALFLIDFLRGKGAIDDTMAARTYVDSLVWAFGQTSQGTHTASGERKAYPSLAVIQLGFLMDHGALRWDPAATAANGKDTGAFTIVTDKLVPAIDEMMKVVGGIKARGDREAAEALLTRYVDGDLVPQAVIAERMLRAPKTSFVYAVER